MKDDRVDVLGGAYLGGGSLRPHQLAGRVQELTTGAVARLDQAMRTLERRMLRFRVGRRMRAVVGILGRIKSGVQIDQDDRGISRCLGGGKCGDFAIQVRHDRIVHLCAGADQGHGFGSGGGKRENFGPSAAVAGAHFVLDCSL